MVQHHDCVYIYYICTEIYTRAHTLEEKVQVTTKTKSERKEWTRQKKFLWQVTDFTRLHLTATSVDCTFHLGTRAHTQTPCIVESHMHMHTSSNRLHFADIPSHCSERGKALGPHTAPLPCPQEIRKATLVYYLLVSLRTKFSLVSDVHSGSSFGTDATLEHSAGEIGGSGGATSLGTK